MHFSGVVGIPPFLIDMKELHSDEYYSTCWACGRVIYDLGLRAYVCRLTNKTIGGNFEAFKPTDCPEWKNT